MRKPGRKDGSIAGVTLCAALFCIGHATGQTPVPAAIQVQPVTANVTVSDRQLHEAGGDADNWLLHGRTYDNQRFSPLTGINAGNVNRLAPVAIIQTGIANSFEATPLVVNGIMYV